MPPPKDAPTVPLPKEGDGVPQNVKDAIREAEELRRDPNTPPRCREAFASMGAIMSMFAYTTNKHQVEHLRSQETHLKSQKELQETLQGIAYTSKQTYHFLQEADTTRKPTYSSVVSGKKTSQNTNSNANYNNTKTTKPTVTIHIKSQEDVNNIKTKSMAEIVKEIGNPDVLAARVDKYGKVRLSMKDEEAKRRIETRNEWTNKIAPSARIAKPSYQFLVHAVPRSFLAGETRGNLDLQDQNKHIKDLKITRTSWLNPKWQTKDPEKAHSSLIVWAETATMANEAINRGIYWDYEEKTVEITQASFRIMQCFRCQDYGHMASTCTKEERCCICAGNHVSKGCQVKERKCANCRGNHASIDTQCLSRTHAKERAYKSRTNFPANYPTLTLQAHAGNDSQGFTFVSGATNKRKLPEEVGTPRKARIGRPTHVEVAGRAQGQTRLYSPSPLSASSTSDAESRDEESASTTSSQTSVGRQDTPPKDSDLTGMDTSND